MCTPFGFLIQVMYDDKISYVSDIFLDLKSCPPSQNIEPCQ